MGGESSSLKEDVVVWSRADSMDRSVLLLYYWKMSIPSIVLALVTTMLAIVSYFFVQPSIDHRYNNLANANFKTLGIVPGELTTNSSDAQFFDDRSSETGISSFIEGDTPGNLQVENVESTTTERQRILQETLLCLRRLIISNKSKDSLRFQIGQAHAEMGYYYVAAARIISKSSDGGGTSSLVVRSQSELQKASDAMRFCQKLNGPYSDKATLWLARQSLIDNQDLTISKVDSIGERVASILRSLNADSNDSASSNENTISYAKLLLAEVRVLQALTCDREDSVKVRVAWLKDAVSLSDSSDSLIQLGWLAVAKGSLNRSEAKDIATRTLQMYWEREDKAKLLPDTLAAVYRCLLLIDSLKEAQVFLAERLQDISPVDQSRFRALTAAASLRHVVSRALLESQVRDSERDSKNWTKLNSESTAVLSMAIQLNPESIELLAFLERYALDKNDDELLGLLKRVLGVGMESNKTLPSQSDVGVVSLLNAVKGFGTKELNKQTETSLAAALKISPAHGIAASRLAVRLHNSGAIDLDLAVRWLKMINNASPDLLAAWSDRASLHLKSGQMAEAVECLEFLHAKLPDNEQIKETLENAKSQLQKSK